MSSEQLLENHKREDLRESLIQSKQTGGITLVDNQEFYFNKIAKFQNQSFYHVENQNKDNLVIQDTFYTSIDLFEEDQVIIKMTLDEIVIHPKDNLFKQTKIQFKNLIGAKILEKKDEAENSNIGHQIQICQLVKQLPKCFGQIKRVLHETVLYSADLQKLQIWQSLFQKLAQNEEYLNIMSEEVLGKYIGFFNQKILAFINPVSGKGFAKNMWKKAKKFLDIAGYQITEIETQRVNHARDYILELGSEEIQEYSGIITVSGDGLPHEVVNALAQRVDSDDALKIGICPLPGGSANAIAKNIAYFGNEPDDYLGTIYQLIKGQKQLIDLVEIDLDDGSEKQIQEQQQILKNQQNTENQYAKNSYIYSLLSVAVSYMADIDLNSEHLRCLGEARFDVYGTIRALFQKPVDVSVYLGGIDQNTFSYNWQKNQNYLNQQENENDINQNKLEQKINSQNKLNINKDDLDKSSVDQQYTQNIMEIQKNAKNNSSIYSEKYGGKCTYFMIQNMPFISTNNYTAPCSKMDDGYQDVQMIVDSSWCALLNQALDFQTGDQFVAEFSKNKNGDQNKSQIEIQKIRPKSKNLIHRMAKNFKIESKNNQKLLFSIDGERYESNVLKGKVLPQKLAIFCVNGIY